VTGLEKLTGGGNKKRPLARSFFIIKASNRNYP
jgi:hypothetical protein